MIKACMLLLALVTTGCSPPDTRSLTLEPGTTLIVITADSTDWIVVNSGDGENPSRVSIQAQEEVKLGFQLIDHQPRNVLRWLRNATNETVVFDNDGDGLPDAKWVTDISSGTTTVYKVESINWSSSILGELPEDFEIITEQVTGEGY